MSGEEQQHTYSVWALPSADVRDRLRSLSSALSSEFGGPTIDVPHVSICEDLRLRHTEAVQRFRSACTGVKPYKVRIAGIENGGSFYQSVYLLIEHTPEAFGVIDHCCGPFDCKRTTPYTPHLSLLYGVLTDEQKEKAKERVKALDPRILDLSFEVSALALYKTDPADETLSSWQQICVCELKTGCVEACC